MTMQDGRRGPLPGLDVRINGPFNELHPQDIEKKLRTFLASTGLGIYADVFRKAMFLAQDPQALDTDEKVQHLENVLEPLVGRSVELKPTEPEKEQLARDKIDTIEDSGDSAHPIRTWKIDGKKWRLPWPLWRLVMLCALGALVQGWDQSAVNSAQLFYLDAFGLGDGSGSTTPQISQPWKVGLVTSAPYLCCIFSCWLTQPLNAIIGRRGTIMFACVFSALSPLSQAFSQSWEVLFAFRFLMGLGIGPKSATIPIYSAECAPENVRGGLVMMWQMFTAFGIMLGYLAGVALGGIVPGGTEACHSIATNDTLLAKGCSLNWRLILGSPMIAPIVLAMYIYTQPESPRWLIAKGHKYKLEGGKKEAISRARYMSAWNALVKLRHEDVQAARDMFLMYHLLEMEQREVKEDRRIKKTKWYQKGVLELVTVNRNWRALRASLICMFAQQFW
jgi:MFS family permease